MAKTFGMFPRKAVKQAITDEERSLLTIPAPVLVGLVDAIQNFSVAEEDFSNDYDSWITLAPYWDVNVWYSEGSRVESPGWHFSLYQYRDGLCKSPFWVVGVCIPV